VVHRAEERAEHRRRVVARHAEPVDAAVAADERARVTVADQRVVFDRPGHDASMPTEECGVSPCDT
jgi:hypothetical protein